MDRFDFNPAKGDDGREPQTEGGEGMGALMVVGSITGDGRPGSGQVGANKGDRD